MSAAVRKVLIIGGGFSGMSAAIQLRKQGVDVDLVEIDKGWRSYGAGITIGCAALRAFGELGVQDEVLRQGSAADGLEIFTIDGDKIATLPTPRCAGPDIPGSGGIMRPVLAKILAKATTGAGANVRLGCTFTDIRQRADDVEIAFTDETGGTYDLVIGADGLYSDTRQAVMSDAPKPRFTGQGVWRAVTPRDGVECAGMCLGRHNKVGFNPVSKSEMYIFLTEERPTNEWVEEDRLLPHLSSLLEEFRMPVIRKVAERLGPDSSIVYRPLENLLVPRPWYAGRVVLIGDAVHATTPHLAAGAGIGIEDAIVLAEELGATDDLDKALENFQQRRWARCRMVVENSMRLGEIEATGGDKEEHSRIMRESMAALAEPI